MACDAVANEGVYGDCGVNGVDVQGHIDMIDMIGANDVRGGCVGIVMNAVDEG